MGIKINKAARLLQAAALITIGAMAFALVAYSIVCAFGFAPWLNFEATFGETVIPEAGMYAQLALTVLISSLLFFMPSSRRVMTLEQSHRTFNIRMEDVTRAYHVCHTADRSGMFTLSSEFDSVRERLAYMRDHPDLEKLEPGVLEVAAQMSQQARHLADVYSDEKVARAKEFLQQRQEEAERQQDRIVDALHACTEIRKWAQQVDVEESIVASQLSQLDEKLQQTLPKLGYTMELKTDDSTGMPIGPEDVAARTNILIMQKKPAAE